jgi:hypothetical protein
LIAADGTVPDPEIRTRLAAQLTAIADHVRPTSVAPQAQKA